MTTVRCSTIRTKKIPRWMELEMHAGGLYLRQHCSLMFPCRSAEQTINSARLEPPTFIKTDFVRFLGHIMLGHNRFES